MSRLARYIAESSSEESSIEDKYDATSFGSQFDSDSSSDTEHESYKHEFSYDSGQESHISLSPGEEYVLDTLFGWMDRPMCAAQQRQSLLLESAKASALQNIKVNRQLYLTNHAENGDDDSGSDSDSFITQEAEEYSEGPEQSYSEAQDEAPAHSQTTEEDYDTEDDQDSEIGDEEVVDDFDEPKQPKYTGQERNVNPVNAIPVSTENLGIQGINRFHSESQEDESDSEGMAELPPESEDDTSAAHRVSFLNTVLKKKEGKVVPSNIFEPPRKKASKAAGKKLPTEVKLSGNNKAVGVPADVQVLSSSKNTRRKSAEAPEEMLTHEVPIEVPLEVSVAMGTETATDVPAEIQTILEGANKPRGRSPSRVKKSRPSPINTDEISDEMDELEVQKKPSLDFLAAKIAQQRNTPHNRSNRDPTPTRKDARSMLQEEKEVKPQTEEQVPLQQVQVQEAQADDLTASREPPVRYSPQSPHAKKTKDEEQARKPRRNSRPDPSDGSAEPVARSNPSVLKEQTVVAKAKKETKATRAKRLSAAKKSTKKKKKVPDVHQGQAKREDEIVDSALLDSRPVQSVNVEELKETLSDLSHPHPQQDELRVNEESKHIKATSVDLADEEQKYVQTQPPYPEQHQVASRERKNPFNGESKPLAQSVDEGQALRKAKDKSAPVARSPAKRHHKTSRVTQNIIQYAPLPTNNQDNPIDIEEYMAQREMLNREAPRMDFGGNTANQTVASPIGVREQAESPRQQPPPRTSRLLPEVALEKDNGVADLPTVANGYPYGKIPKQRNYYFEKESSRQSTSRNNFGIRQPKQFDALARNDPAGHMTNHEYNTKKKSKKSSSGKSKSNLASIEDLKELEKRIEEHFRNSYAVDNDNRSAVSTKELRKLERQLVLQLRRVEEKRAAKLERLRSKKKSSRRQRDIIEAEVIAVEPKDEGVHHYSSPTKLDSKKKSADFRDANRYEQLQALRLSKEMGRYMSKQSGQAATTRYQGQAY